MNVRIEKTACVQLPMFSNIASSPHDDYHPSSSTRNTNTHNHHHKHHELLTQNMYSLFHNGRLLAVATDSAVYVSRVKPITTTNTNTNTTTTAAVVAKPSVTDVNKIEDVCSREEEKITHIKWIFDRSRKQRSGMSLRRRQHFPSDAVLAVGTSLGYVKFYAADGKMIHEQLFHNTPVRRIKIRIPSQLTAYTEEDLAVVYPDQIAVVDTTSLRRFFADKLTNIHHHHHHNLQDNSTPQSKENTSHDTTPSSVSEPTFEYKKYAFGSEDFVDAMCCGPVEESVLAVYHASSMRQFLAVGTDHMLCTFTVAADAGTSFSATAIATNVASKVGSAMYSFAKSFIWGNNKGNSNNDNDNNNNNNNINNNNNNNNNDNKHTAKTRHGQSDGRGEFSMEEQTPERIEPAIQLAQEIELVDPRRRMESIQSDPTGRYAACTDSLGRIMIVDLYSMIIIRMLKGYRNAQCAWMLSTDGCTEQSIRDATTSPSSSSSSSVKGLFLVVLSAVRRIIEVWDVGRWECVGSVRVDEHHHGHLQGCLVQEDTVLIGDRPSSPKKSHPENAFPSSCLFLQSDGDIFRIHISSKHQQDK